MTGRDGQMLDARCWLLDNSWERPYANKWRLSAFQGGLFFDHSAISIQLRRKSSSDQQSASNLSESHQKKNSNYLNR